MDKFVLGTETHAEAAQILFLSIVGQGEDDKGEESTVDRRVAHELLLVPTSRRSRMVVHIVSTKKDTPVAPGGPGDEGRGRSFWFGDPFRSTVMYRSSRPQRDGDEL